MTDNESEQSQFVAGEKFTDWFEKNQDLINEMHRSDSYELLYAAWFEGYSRGLDYMSDVYLRHKI